MKVLFDHQIFSIQTHGGISRYFVELIQAISQMDGIEPVINTKWSNNRYLLESKLAKVNPIFPNRKFPGQRRLIWCLNNVGINHGSGSDYFDLLHPTYYHPLSLRKFGNKPVVITIHDMIYEKFPHLFPHGDTTSDMKKYMIERSDIIIAVSESTKRDLVELLGVNEHKIFVVYHGNSLVAEKYNYQEINISGWLPGNYILFVGRRDAHKNFYQLFMALAPLMRADNSLHLVCTGGGAFSSQENHMITSSGVSSRVLQGDFNDEVLTTVYKHAVCHVLPSLYEGFGMTLLEAFSNGCPVVCSHTGSIPEIAADAAAYFDPYSEDDIRNVLRKVIYDETYRNDLMVKGDIRSQDFTWRKTALNTVGVYEKILGH
jgi:glycosyltransferase involved in cell wall biosynthesis